MAAETALLKYDGISVKDLLNGQLPERPDLEHHSTDYTSLAEMPLHPYVSVNGTSRRFYLVGPQVNGLGLNVMMYFVAPDKSQGMDRHDLTKGDWTDLYKINKDPEHKKLDEALIARHRRIPGWDIFEKMRIKYHEALKRDGGKKSMYSASNGSGNFVVMPSWETTLDENGAEIRQWSFQADEVQRQVVRDTKWIDSKFPSNPEHFDTALGALFTAVWAPEITDSWGKIITMSGEKSAVKNTGNQFMRPTQALPLTLWKSPELFGQQLFKKVEEYCADSPPTKTVRL